MSSLIRSLAVSVLSRYLGEYVVGIDSEHLSVSISSGDAVLQHVELRREALDALDLPICVTGGYLDQVRINIPWTAIKSQPASIEISGLYVLAGPRADADFDPQAEFRRAQSNKQKRLVLAEMLRPGSDSSSSQAKNDAGGDGFTSRLIALVLNNLQVTVRHVHIRYEDALTTPERPFVCGVTLESFRGVTVNTEGVPAFVVEPTGFIHKLVELRNFAVYWDSCGEHLQFSSGEQMGAALNDLIWKELQAQEPRLSYLLRPVSGTLRLSMLRDVSVSDFSKPQFSFDFIFETIAVTLHDHQYKDFAALAEGFRLYQLRAPYSGLDRPRQRPKEDPAAWWKYTISAVLQDVREERARWSWDSMRQRKEDRQRYLVQYCAMRRGAFVAGDVASKDALELVALEEKLSYEDILMYRSLSEALLRRDSVSSPGGRDASSPPATPTKDIQQPQQGYLGWMMGWGTPTAGAERGSPGSEEPAVITPKLMTELYQAVDLDASGRSTEHQDVSSKTSSHLVLPSDYVRRKIIFRLNRASLELYKTSNEPFSSLLFGSLTCTLKSRGDSHSFGARLRSAEVFHGKVPIVVSSLQAGEKVVFSMKLGINKPEKQGSRRDFSLKMHLRPLSFLFSRPFTEGLVHFFVRKRGTAWRDIQEFTGASSQIEALQKQAANQLRQVVDQKRSVYLEIHVDRPRFFVPEDVGKPMCSVLMVEMDSLLVGTIVRERLDSNALTPEFIAANPALFYDCFSLDVSAVEFSLAKPVLSGNGWRWEDFGSSRGEAVALMEPFGMSFSLEKCLVDVPYLAAIKLSTRVPSINAFFSAAHFLSFVTCLRTVISDDSVDPLVDPSVVAARAIVPFGEEEILSLAEPQEVGQWMVSSEKKQKMQLSFNVDEAAVTLRNEKSSGPLARLIMRSFSVNMADLPQETHFSIFLQSLQLIDVNQPAESPSRFVMRSAESSEENLISLRFLSIHREASSFEGVDYEVDLQMQKIWFACNRSTVASLIDLFNDILDGLPATAPEEAIINKRNLDVSKAAGLFLKVRFRMQALNIQFIKEDTGTPLAVADIEKWDQSMRFLNNETWSLDIRVGTTKLIDVRPLASKWSHVLELRGEDALHFTFETMLPNTAVSQVPLDCHPGHASRGLNMLLTFRIRNMRYVYMQNFVTEWIRYFVEIHSMQQMIAASYNRAAGLAVNTAATEQLLCYKIHLENPLIVVPRSFSSSGFAMLDLGTVHISNSYCVDGNQVRFQRTDYNLSNMNITLENWKTSSFGEFEGLEAGLPPTKILKDMTVSFAHEEIEDATLAGPKFPVSRWSVECSAINVVLSEMEAEWLFATVRENLVADAQQEETRTAYRDYQLTTYLLAEQQQLAADRSELNKAGSPTKRISTLVASGGQTLVGDATLQGNLDDGDATPLALSPHMVSEIELRLAKVEVQLLAEDGGDPHGSATMVTFDIYKLDIHMTTDSTGYALSEYDLESVQFFDRRYNVTNSFPKTLSSKKGGGTQELHLTQVSYVNGDKDFMLTIAHPRIVLLPWAYRDLWDFVWPMFEKALGSWDLWVSDGHAPQPKEGQGAGRGQAATGKENKEGQEETEKEGGAAPDWTFRVTVTDPEIVLVSDAATSPCDALVLKGTVLFKHSEPGEGGQTRTIHFRQLEAFRCLFSEADDGLLDDDNSSVSLVAPTDITVFHEWLPNKQREKWDVDVEPMDFTISYHDFRLLSKLYKYWWPEETKADSEFKEPEPILVALDALDDSEIEELEHNRRRSLSLASSSSRRSSLSEKSISGESLSASDELLETPPSQAAADVQSSSQVEPTATLQTIYKLSTQGTLVRLVNDFYVGNVPVALVSLPQLVVRISQTADGSKVFASATFLAEVYNDVAQAWEPVVEPFTGEMSFAQSFAAGTRISMTADSVLDVNLTEAAIDMLFRTWRDLSADFYQKSEELPAIPSSFRTLAAPFVIRNDTGAPVWVWRVDEEGEVVEAPIHGFEVPLPEAKNRQFLHPTRFRNLDIARQRSSICIKVAGDLRVARDYPINDVGSHILRVDPEGIIKLVLQITNQKGGKLLQVRSNVRFCNATDKALELEGSSQHMGRILLTVMQPGSVYALPMAFLRRGRIRVRPATEPFDWSAQSISVSTIRKNSALMLCPPEKEAQESKVQVSDFALFCVMDPPVEDPGALLVAPEEEHAVTFAPPVLLESLLGITLQFRLSNADTEKVIMQGRLAKGQVAQLHLDVRQRLLLSLRLPDFHWSAPRGFLGPRAANSIEILDASKVPLALDLHYVKYPSGLTKVSIFTQFWILNTTQVPLIHTQYSMNSRIVIAGQTSNIKAIQDMEMELSSAKGSIQSEEGIALADASKPPRSAEAGQQQLRQEYRIATTNALSEFPPEFFRPIMYFPEKTGKKMSFRGAFTHWSEPFTVGDAGSRQMVSLPQAKRPIMAEGVRSAKGLYQFVVSVERATGRFWRTRIVSIKPRIVLVNHTKKELLCSQLGANKDSQHEILLKQDEQRPFHWFDAKKEQLLIVCFAEANWNWSPGFPVSANHKMTIKARNLRGSSALLKVRIMEVDGPLLVVFDEEHPEFPTYRIHNVSSEPVLIHQYLAVPHIYETIEPGMSVAYAWDDPTISPLLLEVMSSTNDEKILLDLDNMGLFNTSDPNCMLQLDPVEGLGHFYGVVTAEGPSRVATIKLNRSAHSASHHLPHGAGALKKESLKLHMSLRGFGVSIINRIPLELVYISMSDINLDFEDNKREQSFDFTIGHLQVDNQSYMTQFPVLLWTPSKREKFFALSLVRAADYVSVHFIKRMSLFVDHMDVSMDDSVFLSMWDFVANVAKSFDIQSSMDVDHIPDALRKLQHQQQKFTVPTDNLKKRQIYLQELNLSGTKLLVSFINTDATADGSLGGETAVSRIIRTYGALVNIERAPVNLDPLVLERQFLSRDELVDRLQSHYVTGVRRGLAKILASADFLGAPMALAGHVREGVRDLVDMPKQGAAEGGARGAMSGLGRGTASLAKSVGYGSFNSLSKISGTIGDGVSALALDENYERERAKLARTRPEHVGEGLAFGARDLGLGIFRGVSGVFLEPVRGARQDGVRGFFTGISRGITGLYVKPAVGAVDLFTRAAEGLKNTTTYWEEKKRVRLPRSIGSEGVLQVFHPHRAEGQFLLYSLRSGKYFEEREFYKAHFTIGVNTVLIVTDASLILVKDGSEDFSIPRSAIDNIVIDPRTYADGIVVLFKQKQEPRKICCVFNDKNFSRELLSLLTKVLHHEVDAAMVPGSPANTPPPNKGHRRRSLATPPPKRGLLDQLLISDDEQQQEIRVMEGGGNQDHLDPGDDDGEGSDDTNGLPMRGMFRPIRPEQPTGQNNNNEM